MYSPAAELEALHVATLVARDRLVEAGMLPATTPQHAEIHAVAEALRTAVNAGNVGHILECWAADGVLMPPHHSSVHGHAAIAEFFRDVFASRHLTFTFTGSNVILLGDVALEWLTYTVVARSVTGGVAAEDVGKGLHVYARQPDGRWRITQDIWNSDRPCVASTTEARATTTPSEAVE